MNTLDKTLGQLIEQHFNLLPDTHALELDDGYSRLLGPLHYSIENQEAYTWLANQLIAQKREKYRHVNYFTFKRLFEEIANHLDKVSILETGSSAHGTNSSLLFGNLAQVTGGTFDTVDLNPETYERVKNLFIEQGFDLTRIKAHCRDSIAFIDSFPHHVNIVYLDSYDLNPGSFEESAAHGLKEFEGLLPKLAEKAFILIDDTPKTRQIVGNITFPAYLEEVDRHIALYGRLPGKGELILKSIENDPRFKVLAHEYQLLLAYSA